MHRYRLKSFLVLSVAVFIFAPWAFAQENNPDPFQLATITVTAEKQENNIQKLPSPVSVFTQDDLADAGIEEIGEVIKRVPNMSFGTTFLGREPVFRGIRTSQFTNKSPVVIYIDGIPHDHFYNFDADLNNIDRVEVLRGPQGALYGKNTIGGVINVVSKEPDNVFNAKCTAELAENDTYRAKASFQGPIVRDKLFFGLSGSWDETRGFMTNTHPGEDYFDGNDAMRVKGLFKWLPTDRTKVSFHMGAGRIRNKNGAVIRSDEVRYHDYRDPEDKHDTDIINLGLNLTHARDDLELTSVTTFSDNETIIRQNLNYYRPQPSWIGLNDARNTVFTQELRIQSNSNDKGMNWLGGIYYSRDKEDIRESGSIMSTRSRLGFDTQKNYPGTMDEQAMAAFGQVTLPLAEKVNFTAGLRYEYIQKGLNQRYRETRADTGALLRSSGYDMEEDWDAFLPKGVLSWNITRDAMVYASVAKGYLAGGLNAYETLKERAKFDEQTSINYEIGAKTGWFDNRLILNAVLFYMDIKDMHVYTFPAPYVFVASNAAEARSKGVEFEVKARPLKGLDITAQLGWINAEYDDYHNFSGNTLQRTPEYTLDLAVQYRHDSGFFARGEFQGNGETFYNDANTDSQKSYEIVNAKIGYQGTGWDVYIYGKNIFDRAYFSYGRPCGIGTLKEVGAPRTLGIVASVHF